MPYIENFALRLIVLVLACVAAANLVAFIKASVAQEPYVFDIIKQLLFPGALGVLGAVMWKPRAK